MSVFNSLYAGQYDEIYAEKSYVDECDLIDEAITRFQTKPVKSLIDVGCGTGTHAIELASRGYQVTGVDLSQAMLDHASRKVITKDLTFIPEFIRGDIRSFALNRKYDLAIMMFAVIGYLSDNEDVLSGLQNIRRHLNTGALFFCDFWYGPSVLSSRPMDRTRIVETGDKRVIRAGKTVLNTESHTADVTFNLWTLQGDKVISEAEETHKMRYFFPQEFILMLSICGFKIKSLTAFPSLDEKLSDTTWNAFAVAEAV